MPRRLPCRPSVGGRPRRRLSALARTLERFLGDVPLPDTARAAVAADYAEADAAATNGDDAAAIAALEHAVQTIEAAKGEATPDLIEPLRRLGAMCQAAGAEDRLLGIRRRIADLAEAAYGPGHPMATMALTAYAEQERHDFGGLSEATAERVGAAVRATFGDETRSVQLVERAFAAAPADQRRTIPLSVARVEALRTIRTDGPLAGLDAIDWAGVRHAYGAARDTPDEIRLLRAPDPDLREDALDRLANSICHQGSVYPASAAAVPFLARLALDPTQPDRPGIIWLLAMVARGATDPSTDATVGSAIRDAFAPFADALLASADDGHGPGPRGRRARRRAAAEWAARSMTLTAAELHAAARGSLDSPLAGLGFRRVAKTRTASWVRAEGDRWLVLWFQPHRWNGAQSAGFRFTVELRLAREPVLYAAGPAGPAAEAALAAKTARPCARWRTGRSRGSHPRIARTGASSRRACERPCSLTGSPGSSPTSATRTSGSGRPTGPTWN